MQLDHEAQVRGLLPQLPQLGLSERDVANSVLLSLSGSGQVLPAYWLNPRSGIRANRRGSCWAAARRWGRAAWAT